MKKITFTVAVCTLAGRLFATDVGNAFMLQTKSTAMALQRQCGAWNLLHYVDVSKIDSRYLADANGKTWVPIGCNICFDRLERPTAEARTLFDGWMTAFAANGGNFMRVWLSCPFVEVMPEKAGVYSPEATENLKWLVKRSEELGIRLKFTFENFRGTGPTTSDKNPEKGIVSFKRPVYLPYAKNMREWFASEACFGIYRDRARHIADAVKDSSAVVAVELWNEVNSTGAGLSLIASWTDRMIPEIQKLFPKQMVLQNLGSFSEPGQLLRTRKQTRLRLVGAGEGEWLSPGTPLSRSRRGVRRLPRSDGRPLRGRHP